MAVITRYSPNRGQDKCRKSFNILKENNCVETQLYYDNTWQWGHMSTMTSQITSCGHIPWRCSRTSVNFRSHHKDANCIMIGRYYISHDDVIKWKHFPRYWPFVRGTHRSPVNSQHKGQWRGALMFNLICARINGWVNNCEASDLRRNRAHHDVIVMS